MNTDHSIYDMENEIFELETAKAKHQQGPFFSLLCLLHGLLYPSMIFVDYLGWFLLNMVVVSWYSVIQFAHLADTEENLRIKLNVAHTPAD